MTKEIILDQIKTMPDEFALDDFFERLIVIEKVNKGLKQIEENKLVDEDYVDQKIEEWLGSDGQN